MRCEFAKLQRWLGRFVSCERGSPAAEFAMVLPMYAAILLATAQIAVIYLANAYLETITEDGARLVLTNQSCNYTQAQFAQAICNDIGALFTCGNLIVQLQQAPASASAIPASMPQFNSSGVLTNPTTYTGCNPGAKMMLVVMYQWPVIGAPSGFSLGNLGNGTYLMVSTQIFQTEQSS